MTCAGLNALAAAPPGGENPRSGQGEEDAVRPGHTTLLDAKPCAGRTQSRVAGLHPATIGVVFGRLPVNAPAFTLTAEAVDARGQKLKEMAKGTPFKLKVTTSQRIHFVLLSVFANGQVDIVPTNQGGFLEAGNHTLTPKGNGAFRITDILTGEIKANEYLILLASTEEFAPPVIVRSRHSSGPDCDDEKRYPMYRFVFTRTRSSTSRWLFAGWLPSRSTRSKRGAA